MKIIKSLVLCIMLVASVALAGSGWQGDYDTRWNITVVDGCTGTVTVYNNCYLTGQGETYVAFMPNQMRGGATNGRVIHINTLDACKSVTQTEAD